MKIFLATWRNRQGPSTTKCINVIRALSPKSARKLIRRTYRDQVKGRIKVERILRGGPEQIEATFERNGSVSMDD